MTPNSNYHHSAASAPLPLAIRLTYRSLLICSEQEALPKSLIFSSRCSSTSFSTFSMPCSLCFGRLRCPSSLFPGCSLSSGLSRFRLAVSHFELLHFQPLLPVRYRDFHFVIVVHTAGPSTPRFYYPLQTSVSSVISVHSAPPPLPLTSVYAYQDFDPFNRPSSLAPGLDYRTTIRILCIEMFLIADQKCSLT